jgi:hypothetical protein
MRKSTALAYIGMLLAGFHGRAVAVDAPKIISFTETNESGQQVRHLSFLLTDEPAKTCIAGDWKKAKPVNDVQAYTKDPAYVIENGRLEVLLVNWACDVYDSYIGTLSNGTFNGHHVDYGLGYNKTIGNVSGIEAKP